MDDETEVLEQGTSDDDVPPTDADEGDDSVEESAQAGGYDDGDDDEDVRYSRRVQKRIDKLTVRAKQAESRAYDAERRASDIETQMAVMRSEVEKLKTYNAAAESQAAEGSLQAKLSQAKARYRQAREELDVDAEMKAQDEMDDIREQMRDAKRTAATRQEKQPEQPQQPRQPRAQDFPKATQDWMATNNWFTSGEYPLLAQVASGIAGQMANEGYDSADPKTFSEMNRRIRDELGPKYAALVKDIDGGKPRGNGGSPPTGGGTPGAGHGPSKTRGISETDKELMRKYGMDPTKATDRQAWISRNDPL